MIVDLAQVDIYVARRYKISQISQRVTHKSSKSLQNIAGISLLYVDKLNWNSKCCRGLGPGLEFDFYNSQSEGILGTSSVDANMAEASTSQPKSKGKGKKKKKKNFAKQDGKQVALGVANKGKKTKGKCFHCGEKGH